MIFAHQKFSVQRIYLMKNFGGKVHPAYSHLALNLVVALIILFGNDAAISDACKKVRITPKCFLDRSSTKPSGDAPSHGQDGLTNSPHLCTTKPVWKRKHCVPLLHSESHD